MYGLLEIDVTDAVRLLHATSPPLSFTAFIVSGVARAAAAHPEVHAFRDWRGRVVQTRHVDVATLIEVPTDQGPFPMVHLVRDADVRDVADLSAEIHTVQHAPHASSTTRTLDRYGPLAARVPGLVRLFYFLLSKSVRMRAMSGTVLVSSVGMFGDGGGFGISAPGLLTMTVLVGGISDQARVIDGEVHVRKVLDLTVGIDHDIVDGAPAARFIALLRHLLENPDLG
jgi:pyruvate/2-oxoglutarate dehydrogenase complex dihydrolipoamide acyltransferase (E2) component